MTKERPSESGEDGKWATFTSAAYQAQAGPAVVLAASDWLEQQAQHPFIREVAERTLEALALGAGERVLELGCGTGVFLSALVARVGIEGRVVGLDHSEAFLEQARVRVADQKLDSTVTLVAGDAHRLPFDDGSFDAAHTERVLMHLEDPDAAIRELIRVVRPGGRVVSAEIHALGASIDHPDHEMAAALTHLEVSGIRNPSMGLELRRRFVSAGLEEVHSQAVITVEDVLDPDEAVEMRAIARDDGQRGELDRVRAEAVVESMIEASEGGMHCGYAIMFIARGRVPGTV